jgi:hypothetical protein
LIKWWNRERKSVGLPHAAEQLYRAPFAAAVPSAIDYFDFDVQCTVVWCAQPGWREVAVRAVAAHVVDALSHYHPTRWQLAEALLAADLVTPCLLIDVPGVQVWAEELAVTVEPRQLQLARHHAQQLRQQQHLDAEHDVERAELRYLRTSVFSDTATAVLWWLHHNDHDVTRIGSVIEELKKTVAVIAGNSEGQWVDTIIETFDAVAPNLNRNGRYELHRNLAQILYGLNEKEKAEILLSRTKPGPVDTLP